MNGVIAAILVFYIVILIVALESLRKEVKETHYKLIKSESRNEYLEAQNRILRGERL